MDPKQLALKDLLKMLDGMDKESLMPKKPEVEIKLEQEPEVAEMDPEEIKKLQQGYDSQTLKPKDKGIKIEKKAIKVGELEPQEMDEDQKKLLEELYSKIG